MSNEPWFRTQFGERYLDAVRDQLRPEWAGQQVEFIEKAVGLKPNDHILDLCCGDGRHAVALAQRGYRLTGLDLDAAMLRDAAQAAERAGVKVQWILGDMRDIPGISEYDVVLNLFTAFGYFESDEEDQKVLEGIARSLKPGGRLFLNTVNREWLLRQFQARDWERLDDGSMRFIERQIDLEQGRNFVTESWYYPDGRRKTMFHILRLYTLTELRRMCSEVGLQLTDVYGDFDGGPYGLDSRWLSLVARKN